MTCNSDADKKKLNKMSSRKVPSLLYANLFFRCCKSKEEFSPITNDSDQVQADQDESNSNKIYKGRSTGNGQPTFHREMKNLNSDLENGDS